MGSTVQTNEKVTFLAGESSAPIVSEGRDSLADREGGDREQTDDRPYPEPGNPIQEGRDWQELLRKNKRKGVK